METKEEYGRSNVTIRWRDIEALAKYAKAANISTTEALDDAIEAGLSAKWREWQAKRFAEEWEELGHA